MIIYTVNGLKAYEIRSACPNTDWTGVAEFVVDETKEKNAELVSKIKEYAPYFDCITDVAGVLVDVVKTGDKPTSDPGVPIIDPVSELQSENKTLKAQISALTESQQFLEDCLVEMAEIVYA